MKKNFPLYKEAYGKLFDFSNEDNTFKRDDIDKTYKVEVVDLEYVPNSFLFENFELIGLYVEDNIHHLKFEFLTKIDDELYSFIFHTITGNLSFSETRMKNKDINIKMNMVHYDNEVVKKEFIKYEEFIIEQIKKSPSERLINLLHR